MNVLKRRRFCFSTSLPKILSLFLSLRPWRQIILLPSCERVDSASVKSTRRSHGRNNNANEARLLRRHVEAPIQRHDPLFLQSQSSLSPLFVSRENGRKSSLIMKKKKKSFENFFPLLKCEDGRSALILDRTVFHPQGGGQPADLGFVTIVDPELKFIVQDVRSKEGIVSSIKAVKSNILFRQSCY